MKLRLLCGDHVRIAADYDPETARLQQRPVDKPAWGEHDGIYAIVDGELAALYRHQGVLWLRLGHHLGRFSDLSFVLQARGETSRQLIVRWPNEVETTSRYEIDPPIPGDMTAMTEPEDFDFGIRLTNLATDPGRQERLYRHAQLD